jgi:hypothetical protein
MTATSVDVKDTGKAKAESKAKPEEKKADVKTK